MNVLLVSQCEKRARTETCRILDQFAERRGERTWQTPITQIGLDTLRKMLRRTARKNTAVACHWIRGHDRSELLWIVGDARRFNAQGAVPTNTTTRDVLRAVDENDWHTAEDIQLLATAAALFHDFGKACAAFQKKLLVRTATADAYRHEWVSLRLFEAFVGPGTKNDRDWITRLSECGAGDTARCLAVLRRDDCDGPNSPFARENLPPLAQVVGWLVLTHHRLPNPQDRSFNARGLKYLPLPISAAWNDARSSASPEDKAACWTFHHGLPFDSAAWRTRAHRCGERMLARPALVEAGQRSLADPYTMHVARMALMLADHHYSSLDVNTRYGDSGYQLYANTNRDGGLKQALDEHLVGVSYHAHRVVRALPRLERELPRIAQCKTLQRRVKDARFRWQDRAYDIATSVREAAASGGFFGVNIASTGCGKTLANGRIAYALSNPQIGARFTVALGLRTLTLQTGSAYRERLGLGDDELAVLVGGSAVRELYELQKRDERFAAAGSESLAGIMPDDAHVHFDGSMEDGPLSQWLRANSSAAKLLHAPIAVCTIDHLIPATESLRGGRQIGPMLRLMTSDLVVDEPDDFDVQDLPALSRLIHWAGMLGSRVLLSSATLPPSLTEGLFEAYRAGRESFQRNRGVVGRAHEVTCAWFDEFECRSEPCVDQERFRQSHALFVDRRIEHLAGEASRRRARIVDVSSPTQDRMDVCNAIAGELPSMMIGLHQAHHDLDPVTHKRASFGLVRFANIEPLIAVAQRIVELGMPNDVRAHVCVYHSRHPLLVRSAIEQLLDATLQRSGSVSVFDHPAVRRALESFPERDHLFVVVASPVAEVGRDHDYDWAVVEPSSMRSIIQLAGRVRRHRSGACTDDNVLIMRRNIRAMQGRTPVFTQPGFESPGRPLASSDLRDLLLTEQLAPLCAVPRIRQRPVPTPDRNLADLEHDTLQRLMLSQQGGTTEYTVPDWWRTAAWLSGVLQSSQRFRAGPPEDTFAVVPSNEREGEFDFVRRDEEWTSVNSLLRWCAPMMGPRMSWWGVNDYGEALGALADRLDLELDECARRFGTVQLRPSTQGWSYHPMLGFRQMS